MENAQGALTFAVIGGLVLLGMGIFVYMISRNRSDDDERR